MKALFLFSLLLISSPCMALVGETLPQCTARYGDAVNANEDLTTVRYQKNGTDIVVHAIQDVAWRIDYTHPEMDLTMARELLRANDPETWSYDPGFITDEWRNKDGKRRAEWTSKTLKVISVPVENMLVAKYTRDREKEKAEEMAKKKSLASSIVTPAPAAASPSSPPPDASPSVMPSVTVDKAPPPTPDEIRSVVMESLTSNGKTYRKARVAKWYADAVSVMHETGIATVPLSDLPLDLAAKVKTLATAEGRPTLEEDQAKGRSALSAAYTAEQEAKATANRDAAWTAKLAEARAKLDQHRETLSLKVMTVVNPSAALCRCAPLYRDPATGQLVRDDYGSDLVFVEGLASPVADLVYEGVFYRSGRLRYDSLFLGGKIVARYTSHAEDAAEWWATYNGSDEGDVSYSQVNHK